MLFSIEDFCFIILLGYCRVKHVMLTSMLLVCGAMTMTWICDTITESGFGTMLDILVTWLAMIILLIFPTNLYIPSWGLNLFLQKQYFTCHSHESLCQVWLSMLCFHYCCLVHSSFLFFIFFYLKSFTWLICFRNMPSILIPCLVAGKWFIISSFD